MSSLIITQQQQSEQQQQQKDDTLNTYFEYIPIKKPVFKNGKKLRAPVLVIDKRGIYPPFIKDADNFLWCNYDGCNDFFPKEKSIYAHHSRKHNKKNNPNKIRKAIKKEKELEDTKRRVMEKHTTQITITSTFQQDTY